MMSRNIAAIISKIIENESLKEAVQYLNEEEQVGFATVVLGCQLSCEELPQIPDNDIARNIVPVRINPIKDRIEIKYEALKEHKYMEGKWQWVELEASVIKYDTISYDNYMKYSESGYKG